jgi:hypothetical protein
MKRINSSFVGNFFFKFCNRINEIPTNMNLLSKFQFFDWINIIWSR